MVLAIKVHSHKIVCPTCKGSTTIPCLNCSSRGELICDTCNGVQLLKWYLQVQVD
jgi:hypothetical protein